MNRPILMLRVGLLAILLLAACGPATPPPTAGPLLPVRINISARTGAHAALWYAHEKGLFQKYGVAVEFLEVPGGSAETLAAMLRGEVDFAVGSAGGAINAAVAGEDRVIVASFYNRPIYTLVVGPDIQTPEDLIGKSIAVTSLGSLRYRTAVMAVESLGLDPAQVNFVPFRDGDEALMVAGIEGGSVSAASMSPPLLRPYREAGLHVLVDLSDLDISYLRLNLNTLRSYIAANRDATLGVLKALLEAIPLMQADPEGTQVVLAKYTTLDPVADAEDLAAMYAAFVTNNIQADLYPSEAALEFTLELEAANNPEAANLSYDQFTDLSLLEEIFASGFMDTLASR